MVDQWLPTARPDDGCVGSTADAVPELVREAGAAARFAFDEFFHGRIRNTHTRKAYLHALRLFSAWCNVQQIELVQVMPGHVGRYLDALDVGVPTRKLHLAALRRFFDELVLRHVVVLNPTLSVRGERYQVLEGRTPEISIDDARSLLKSIRDSHVVALRDRAVIGILIYTAARVGAVARLTNSDYYAVGGQQVLRFQEKGGKLREIPVRHDLREFIEQFLERCDVRSGEISSPMFRSAIRKTKQLTDRAMTADDMARMVKRRLRRAGLSARLSPHSFRVMTITDLLQQGVPLEDVQYLAGHADPRTTRLYDRRQRRVTRNIVERISV
jgi:site-specific recombinase XerD